MVNTSEKIRSTATLKLRAATTAVELPPNSCWLNIPRVSTPVFRLLKLAIPDPPAEVGATNDSRLSL